MPPRNFEDGLGRTDTIGPESCGGNRKAAGEALTGAHAGQPLSCAIRPFGVPTPLSEAEGQTVGGDQGQPPAGSAQSKTLRTRGNSMHRNREVPQVPVEHHTTGRPKKDYDRTFGMHACGKSDAHESAGYDMQEKQAQKLLGRQRHHCDLGKCHSV